MLHILCVLVALQSAVRGEGVPTQTKGCACHCQRLELEINVLKQMILQIQEPVPELLSSIEQTVAKIDNDRRSEEPVAHWTESLITSTYTTLLTSLAFTEVPIWWRNRQTVTTITDTKTVQTVLTRTSTTSVLEYIYPSDLSNLIIRNN